MSVVSPAASIMAQHSQFLELVKIYKMPMEIAIPCTESLHDDGMLNKEIAAQIKKYSGDKQNKTYYENLFLMRVAMHLDTSTAKGNIVYYYRTVRKKKQCRIFGIICNNGYILIPRCEVALFKSIRMWMFCSPSIKPDVVVFYHRAVTYLFQNMDKFQKEAFKLLKKVRSQGIPLLYIEEQSSTIMQTALCCSLRVVEHHRLLRSIGIETGELFGFAFPRQTEPIDTNVTYATDIYISDDQVDDDDDDQIAQENTSQDDDADTSINEVECATTSSKKATKATAPIKISVKWVSEDMAFYTSYEAKTEENVWSDLIAAVESAKQMVLQLSSWVINSFFFFKLSQQELDLVKKKITSSLSKKRCGNWDWLKTAEELQIFQLPSAPSFVFQLKSNSSDKSCIVKYFVHVLSEHKFIKANRILEDLDQTEIVRFCLPYIDIRSDFHFFEQLLPPLTTGEANCCIQSLCNEVHEALTIMHSMGLAHLDVRLPNICFRFITSKSIYVPVLIDYERAEGANDSLAQIYESSDLYPPMLKNKYTDYVQLFTMALGTKHRFITSFVRRASQNGFNSTDLNTTFNAFIKLLQDDNAMSVTDILTQRT